MDIENVMIKTEHTDEDYCDIVEEQLDIKPEVDSEPRNEKPYKCGICGHRTTTDTLLKVHMKMHLVKRVHQCNVCKITFNFVTELNSHILTHTDDKSGFQCEICGRDCFTEEDLHKHYRVHTKEKPFKCQKCFRSFSEDSYLRVHERSHHGEEYMKKVMKKDGTYVDPSLVQNLKDESTPKVSVNKDTNPKKFKNNPNLPLNHEEKLLLLRYVEEFGLNKEYSKLENIKSYVRSSWAKMVKLFADSNYDRNVEKLARTYFHLKNQAKTHIERFYKHKKLPEPHDVDYIFVKLCPTEFEAAGIDIQQILEDGKKYTNKKTDMRDIASVSSEDEQNDFEEMDALSERLFITTEDSQKRNSEEEVCGPPKKIPKIESSADSNEVTRLKLKFLAAEEQRKIHLYRIELKEKKELFEMEKKYREEMHRKELEIKDLELCLLKQKVDQNSA